MVFECAQKTYGLSAHFQSQQTNWFQQWDTKPHTHTHYQAVKKKKQLCLNLKWDVFMSSEKANTGIRGYYYRFSDVLTLPDTHFVLVALLWPERVIRRWNYRSWLVIIHQTINNMGRKTLHFTVPHYHASAAICCFLSILQSRQVGGKRERAVRGSKMRSKARKRPQQLGGKGRKMKLKVRESRGKVTTAAMFSFLLPPPVLSIWLTRSFGSTLRDHQNVSTCPSGCSPACLSVHLSASLCMFSASTCSSTISLSLSIGLSSVCVAEQLAATTGLTEKPRQRMDVHEQEPSLEHPLRSRPWSVKTIHKTCVFRAAGMLL